MLPRLLALAIALTTAATGVLPTGGGARCVAMNRVMSAGRDCCPKCEAPATTSIGTPCCEAIRGVTLSERAASATPQPQIAPAPLVALLSPALAQFSVDATARRILAMPRGRPPGDQLQRYTSVLRI
ncbi:MAG TPA: hypothetical protein VHB97_16935 [Polyangia bacterium]|nr:hypothetical protein [Polyangia bacterium]